MCVNIFPPSGCQHIMMLYQTWYQWFDITKLLPNVGWICNDWQVTSLLLYRWEPGNHRYHYPDSKVHEAYMGPIWGRQDPGGPHVGPMNLAIRAAYQTVWLFFFSPTVAHHIWQFSSKPKPIGQRWLNWLLGGNWPSEYRSLNLWLCGQHYFSRSQPRVTPTQTVRRISVRASQCGSTSLQVSYHNNIAMPERKIVHF